MKEKPLYYGWVNLLLVWLVSCLSIVPFFYSFGIVAQSMSLTMGRSMTIITGAYTLHNIIFAFISPLHGKFVTRFGIKNSLLLGMGAGALAFAAMASLARYSCLLYYILWMVPVSVFLRFGGSFTAQMCISRWFFRHRGLALSIFFVAGGLGGYLFTPFFQNLSSRHGWQSVWWYLAAAGMVCFLLLALFFRESPEPGAEELRPLEDSPRQSFRTTRSWTCRQAMGNIRFYLIILILALSQFTCQAVCNTGVQYLSDCGMDPALAASRIGMFALISVAGRLVMGVLGDRTSARLPMTLGCIAGTVGMAMMRIYNPSWIMPALILTGIGYGIVIVAPVSVLLDYFGSGDSANIIAWYSLIGSCLSAGSSVLFGLFYDYLGSYTQVWSVGAGFFLLCAAIAYFMGPPKTEVSAP